MDVTISVRRDDNVATVIAAGEIDSLVRERLLSEIEDAVRNSGMSAVEVDLAAVTFLDSSGIAALVKGRRTADAVGVAYRVVGARGMARQVLTITGVWELLTGDAG